MLPIERVRQELKVSLYSLKKSISEIAIITSDNVEIMKLTLRISEMQRKMDKALTRLGEIAYQKGDLIPQQLLTDQEVREIQEDIHSNKLEILHLESQISDLRDEILNDQVFDLRKILKSHAGTVEETVLLPHSPWVGKRVAELLLPSQVLLIALLRDTDLLYPRGQTILQAGDRTFLMGRRLDVISAIEASKQVFRLKAED